MDSPAAHSMAPAHLAADAHWAAHHRAQGDTVALRRGTPHLRQAKTCKLRKPLPDLS